MLLASFLVLAVLVRAVDGPLSVDVRLYQLLDRALLRIGVERYADLPTAILLGHPVTLLVLVGVPAAVSAAGRRWADVAVLALGPALAVVLGELVAKPLVGRRNTGAAYTFPSGTAAATAGVVTAIAIIVWRRGGWSWLTLSVPVLAGVPAVVGVAILGLNWHHATDILAGFLLGSATSLAVSLVCRPGPPGRGTSPGADPGRRSRAPSG